MGRLSILPVKAQTQAAPIEILLNYSESFEDGQALLKAATRLGLEGVVSKKRGSAYHSGLCHKWAKIKSTAWRDANRDRWKLFEKRG